MDVKPPVHAPEGDKRFADPTWGENQAFFAVRQRGTRPSRMPGENVPG